MKKRLGIFLFYSPTGKVYEYVRYLLTDMRSCLDELVIVCNGFLSAEGKGVLEAYADTLVIRPNEGFDFAGWKEGIVHTCGFEHVSHFDELVLFNDSFFGPFSSFSNVFALMDEDNDIDFWGLTSHGEVKRANGIGRPRYLQTYFLVLRKRILVDESFRAYWDGLEPCGTFATHVEQVASRFTEHFENLGFRWTAAFPTFDLEDQSGRHNMSHHMYNTYEMVARRGLPIIKRKTFTMSLGSHLVYSDAESLVRALEYVQRETDYDTGLIWDYLLENSNIKDLMDTLHLYRFLPAADDGECGRPASRVAVIAHLFYEDLFSDYLEKLSELPAGIDICITTSDADKRERLLLLARELGLPSIQVRVVERRGRDISALLMGARDIVLSHTYVCFLHDKKPAVGQGAQSGKLFAQFLLQSTIASPGYVQAVIKEFEAHPRLGVTVPPKPYFATHFARLPLGYWTMNYERVQQVLSRLCVQVPLSPDKDCVAIGTALWFRTDALRPLFEARWSIEDFPNEPLPSDGSVSHAIERCFPYVAQSQGYYTMQIAPDCLSELLVSDYRYMLEETLRAVADNPRLDVSGETYVSFIAKLRQRVSKLETTGRRAKLKRIYRKIERRVPPVGILKDMIKNALPDLWSKI